MKISEFFYLKIFIFLVVKFSVYLNRHVFGMHDGYLSGPGYFSKNDFNLC